MHWQPKQFSKQIGILNVEATMMNKNNRIANNTDTKFWYTLPAKNMEYFLFQRLFAFLWGVQGISVLLEELIST